MRILVVHSASNSELHPLMKDPGFGVEFTTPGQDLSEKLHLYEYDCIIHYQKPEESLQRILESEYAQINSGIIVISSSGSIQNKVDALNAGADDYLCIPFHIDELKARVLAVVRRKKFNTRKNIHFANLIIDLESRSVLVWNNPVLLTRKEYEILLYFIMNRNKVVSSTMVCEYLWNEETDRREFSNLLITHIKNLRKKLKLAKAELEIKNVYGVGYQIIEL